MAYVNVAEWKPDQVTEWIRGLDSCVEPYVQGFLNNSVGGAQILSFGADDLEHLGITKIGHQEIILEGIDHLRNIHYELDRENLQLLGMRLSCLAHSLHSELASSHAENGRLSTQILADISTIVTAVKPLIAWLDRPGFCGEIEYERCRSEILKLALRMATCGQRDRFVATPVADMKTASAQLAKLADSIVQDMSDPLILQPASLDLVTIKKRSSDDLGFYIVPSFRGVHKISDMKLNSAAHQSGKIEPGDEIIQINYQTVVGWSVKEVVSLIAESPNEILLTLKKRPRHTKIYGQIYVKPYRLPSKKRAIQQAHTAGIHFRIPIHSLKIPVPSEKKKRESRGGGGVGGGGGGEAGEGGGGGGRGGGGEDLNSSSSSDEEMPSLGHKLIPSKPVHRRATITGASPLSKRPPFNIHELWHEMKLEKESWSKQSSTSVVDFEERLSRVGRGGGGGGTEPPHPPPQAAAPASPAPSSASPPPQSSGLETLSIRQKIEIFSRSECEKKERSKTTVQGHGGGPLGTQPPPQAASHQHPHRPFRVSSEPLFGGVALTEAGKVIAGARRVLPSPQAPAVDLNKSIQNTLTDQKTSSTNVRRLSSELKSTTQVKNEHLSQNKSDIESAETSSKSRASGSEESLKSISESTEKLKKVDNISVEKSRPQSDYFEKQIKVDNVSYEKNIIQSSKNINISYECSPDKFKINDNVLPSTSKKRNSEPLVVENEEHGQIVQTINKHLLMHKLSDDSDVLEYPCYKGKTAESGSNSLPHHGKGRATGGGKSTHSLPSRGGRGETSASDLSRTIAKVITEESERLNFTRNKIVKSNKKSEPPLKTGGSSIFYSSESLDQAGGVRLESARRSAESDLVALKYNSLEDRHLRREMAAADGGGAPGGSPPSSPPVPPPRPSLAKPSNPCYRAAIMAAHHLIGKASPKAHRKKQLLLSKGRKVSVKDMPVPLDMEGWLTQRCRRGSATWNRRYCLIHSAVLYIFSSKQASKAESYLSLPGFTVAPAEEVKSRPYAFKVYHMGTMFYLAAESAGEYSDWLDAIHTSTLAPNPNGQDVVYSESEGEEMPVKKAAPTPAPRPLSRSSDGGGGSMLGSLKKLGGGGGGSSSVTSSSGGSSLDRKCLRLLGGPAPRPVPTAHYRSYRRVNHTPVPPIPPPQASSSSLSGGHRDETGGGPELDHVSSDMADYRLTSQTTPPVPRRRRTVLTGEGGQLQQTWSSQSVRLPPPSSGEDGGRREGELGGGDPLSGSIPSPPSPWESGELGADPFSHQHYSRKNIKMKKPHLGGGIRGLFPSAQAPSRPPLRPSPQQETVSRSAGGGGVGGLPVSPDYPGLEYPPVFEPGTYTLDTSSLLRSSPRSHLLQQPPSPSQS